MYIFIMVLRHQSVVDKIMDIEKCKSFHPFKPHSCRQAVGDVHHASYGGGAAHSRRAQQATTAAECHGLPLHGLREGTARQQHCHLGLRWTGEITFKERENKTHCVSSMSLYVSLYFTNLTSLKILDELYLWHPLHFVYFSNIEKVSDSVTTGNS